MNRSLWLGLIGTSLLLVTVVFGSWLAPYTMDQFGLIKRIVNPDGTFKYFSAPFPPSKDYWLGTDSTGRDMLSILLRGARVTVTFAVTVAVARLLIALPLAYGGAIFPKTLGWLNEKLSLAFTTVPAVIVVYLLSLIFTFSDVLSTFQNLEVMAFLIAIVGLFPTVHVLQAKMESILRSSFIEGIQAVGASKWRMLRKHLIPHITSYTTILFVSEIAQILWLVGQLGVILVFLGGTVNEYGLIYMKIPEEWSGKIGFSFRGFQAHPMTVIYPALALSFAILSFNLLADGIRKLNEGKWGIRS